MSVEIAWKQNILVTDSNLLKSLLVVFGFGSQAFICGFSRQNICSVPPLVLIGLRLPPKLDVDQSLCPQARLHPFHESNQNLSSLIEFMVEKFNFSWSQSYLKNAQNLTNKIELAWVQTSDFLKCNQKMNKNIRILQKF